MTRMRVKHREECRKVCKALVKVARWAVHRRVQQRDGEDTSWFPDFLQKLLQEAAVKKSLMESYRRTIDSSKRVKNLTSLFARMSHADLDHHTGHEPGELEQMLELLPFEDAHLSMGNRHHMKFYGWGVVLRRV